MCIRVEFVLPVSWVVVTLLIAPARRRSFGRIRLYACHFCVYIYHISIFVLMDVHVK